MKQADIHKAGGVFIHNRKFLVSRSRGKTIFFAPGGKLEANETAVQALIREIKEELTITITEHDLERLGTFYAPAAGQEDRLLEMEVFIITSYRGTLQPSHEIEEIRWIDSTTSDLSVGSIMEHEVLPQLKQLDLID